MFSDADVTRIGAYLQRRFARTGLLYNELEVCRNSNNTAVVATTRVGRKSIVSEITRDVFGVLHVDNKCYIRSE